MRTQLAERRAQDRLLKDFASIHEFEGEFGRRFHRERRQADVRIQSKLDENAAVLTAHSQSLAQRLQETQARITGRIGKDAADATMRLAARQRDMNEAAARAAKALEHAERESVARLTAAIAATKLERAAEAQATGASALATVERVGGIEAAALAHEMAAAPRALRAAEAVAAVSMAAGRREAALQAAQLRAESERAGQRSRATQRAAIRRIETVVVG